MQLAKFDNGQLITTYADNEDRDIINQMVADGFKVYTEEEPPAMELSAFQSLELEYREEDFQIVGYYKIIDNSPKKVSSEIERLKAELTATDYQVIKSYEYALAGEPLPYNLTNLHSERQQLRERINKLEHIMRYK